LAIEQNSLSLEQVSALFDGQRVIGPARDIQEVRNAIAAYDALPRWDPANPEHLLAAHGLLMAGLIDAPGRFRSGGVGIYRGDQLVHMAPPAARVPDLVNDLLTWLAASAWHPLLVSCVAHYELEFIHPFADGNGRLGRLWQTLILSRWNPLLAWLPIEEVIRSRQQGYYESLGQADQLGDLEPFVSYQLEAIHDALRSEISSEISSEMSSEKGSEVAAKLGTSERSRGWPSISGDPGGSRIANPPSRPVALPNGCSSASERWRSIWQPCSGPGACSAKVHPVPAIGGFFRLIPWH
jgi:Fic family protein